MSFFRRLSLRSQLLSLVVCIVLAGFALTLSFMTYRASQIQQATALRYVNQLAAAQGGTAIVPLEQATETARTLASTLGTLKTLGQTDRQAVHRILREVLEKSPNYVAVWTGWEPDAFDGRDAEFSSIEGHDASGRFVPYWNRGGSNGSIVVEPLIDYDKPGVGDFYQIPKSSKKSTLLEPYPYMLGGKNILITTVSAPIVINGQFMGVAGIDIALSRLQNIVSGINVYDTGYASLYSSQGVIVGDKDAENLGKVLSAEMGLPQKLVDELRHAIRSGQHAQGVFNDPLLNNTEATIIQVPISIEGIEAPWSFSIVVPTAKIQEEIRALQWLAVGLGVLSIALTSIGLAIAVDRLVLRPIGGEPSEAAALAQRVAQGDLSRSIHVRPGDTWSLMFRLKQMQDSLMTVVAQVREGAQAVATASAQISMGNQDLSGRTESQASALQETAASMEELGATVRQNADHAQNARTLAHEASQVAEHGGASVGQVVRAMQGINASSGKISDIIGVIDGIAFQTNILALNAAVEAARAGEQGRGFAVVAGEVRTLAQRSAEAAKEIKTLIGGSVRQVEEGSGQVDDAGMKMEQVVDAIRRVSTIVKEISEASREQAAGVEQVGEAVTQMDQVTQQNAALVEEMAAAASSLSQQAQALVRTVAVFKLADRPNNSLGQPTQEKIPLLISR